MWLLKIHWDYFNSFRLAYRCGERVCSFRTLFWLPDATAFFGKNSRLQKVRLLKLWAILGVSKSFKVVP